MKYLVIILFVNLFILACTKTQDKNNSSTLKSNQIDINDFEPDKILEIPVINLPKGNYANFNLNNYTITGKVDNQNFKQGLWIINNHKTNDLFKGVYENNKKSNIWIYSHNNKINYEGEFKNDKKNGLWCYRKLYNNQIKCMNYTNDTLYGLAVHSQADSILIEGGTYYNGLKDGYWKTYYKNSHINAQGNYTKNLKTGWWQFFCQNGKLIQEANYMQNSVSGNFKKYQNGVISEEGTIINNKKNGIWKYYNTQGKQIRIHNYDE